MVSKQNIKYFLFVSFISILFYKFIDKPLIFLRDIGSLFRFLAPFLGGILIALLLNPFISFLDLKLKTPRLLNIIISYAIILIFAVLIFKSIIPSLLESLNDLIKDTPTLMLEVKSLFTRFLKSSNTIENITPHIEKTLDKILTEVIGILTQISSGFTNYMLSITSLVFNIVMSIVLSIYILLDKEKIGIGIKKLLFAFTTQKRALKTINFFKRCHKIFYEYIIGKLIDSLIIGVLAFIGFYFIKIEYILLLSFIIFLTNIIPYFGPFIGAVPPIIMTLSYSPIKALWVALFIFILQQVDGNFIGPKVMGESVGLSALWIICAVLIGSSLFGIVGVFLSVPIAAIIKSCLDIYVENNLSIKKSE